MDRHHSKLDVVAQAERWLVRLMAEDCSAAERMAFRRWRANPEHAAAYADTQALWQDIGSVAERADIQALARQVLAETENGKRKTENVSELRTPNPEPRETKLRASASPREPLLPGPRPQSIGDLRIGGTQEVQRPAHNVSRPPSRISRRLAHAAAFAVVAVALGALLLYEPGVYTTGLGERETVTLADGSIVTLNTETRLEVHYTDNVRRLDLVRGEALFDVSHDPRRPFLVAAGSGSVTALGTRFQVRRDHQQVRVTLLEGRVVVDRPAIEQRVEMQPGEQVSFVASRDEIVHSTVVDREAAVSWTNGRLVFRATPLSEAVAEVNRYARTKIRIADPLLLDLPISGTFATGDSENLAAALETEMPVRVDYSRDDVILLRFARK